MTDLCYNCGACHLPAPCAKPPQTCDICQHLGHSWNFCHRGALNFDPGYKYHALCHNCDVWHLPEPCKKDEVHCQTCNSHGHLRFYCPESPAARPLPGGSVTGISTEAPTGGSTVTPGNKRQRQDMNTNLQSSPRVNYSIPFDADRILSSVIMAEEVYKLKMTVVKDTLDILNVEKPFRPREVFAYMAQMYLGKPNDQQSMLSAAHAPPTPRSVASAGPAWNSTPRDVHPIYQGPGHLQENVNPYDHHSLDQTVNQVGTTAYRSQGQFQPQPASASYQERRFQYNQNLALGNHQHTDPQSLVDPRIRSGSISDLGPRSQSDVNRQDYFRPTSSGDGDSKTTPSLHLPLSNDAIQPIGMGSSMEDAPRQQIAQGSPKVAYKRVSVKKTNPRQPRKLHPIKPKQSSTSEESQQSQQVSHMPPMEQYHEQLESHQPQHQIHQQTGQQAEEQNHQQTLQESLQQAEHSNQLQGQHPLSGEGS